MKKNRAGMASAGAPHAAPLWACLGLALLASGCEPAPVAYPMAYPAPPAYGTLPPPVPAYGNAYVPEPAVAPPPTYPAAPAPPPVQVEPAPALPELPPLSSTTPPPAPSSDAAPVAPPADASDRFQSLKSNLEHQADPPAAPVAAATAPPPASTPANGCTSVHTRSGFHDHYGGLNSAGDVLPSCAGAAR